MKKQLRKKERQLRKYNKALEVKKYVQETIKRQNIQLSSQGKSDSHIQSLLFSLILLPIFLIVVVFIIITIIYTLFLFSPFSSTSYYFVTSTISFSTFFFTSTSSSSSFCFSTFSAFFSFSSSNRFSYVEKGNVCSFT